jgi:LysM repeat protein
MNKEDPYRDQAEKLRQKIDRTQFEEGQVVEREDLPPRSRVHYQKQKKNKWKLKHPVIRLLMLFFILLPITIFSIYSSIAKDRMGGSTKTGGESSEVFETINIEKYDDTNLIEEKNKEEEKNDYTEEGKESLNGGSESSTSEGLDQSVGTKENANEASPDGLSNSEDTKSTIKENESVPPGTVYHTVHPGENIYRISMKYYKSDAGIDTIKTANGLTSNEIRVGQVLTIPLNK